MQALAVAIHVGLDYELKLLDFRNRDHKSPQYSTLNPNMRMPPAAARFPLEPDAEIRRWFKTLQALPAWQKTLAQTGTMLRS
jgi:glutathione S-transferase